MSHTYNPEHTIDELRRALLDREDTFRELADIMVQAAAHAEGDLWPDPVAREQAGLGCIVAAASIAAIAKPGPEGVMLNLTGYFGLALVDSARDELRRTGGSEGRKARGPAPRWRCNKIERCVGEDGHERGHDFDTTDAAPNPPEAT